MPDLKVGLLFKLRDVSYILGHPVITILTSTKNASSLGQVYTNNQPRSAFFM